MRLFRKVVRSLLATKDLTITGLTKRDLVIDLIRRLRPLKSEAGLIRLGPCGDGGYLVPDDLQGIKYCFSPGVAVESGFELDCAKRGIKCFLADGSVLQAPIKHENIVFRNKFIGAVESSEFITLDDWVKSEIDDQKDDLILQMDVEGFEYEVLASLSIDLLKRFRTLVIEFHYLDRLWNESFYHFANVAFSKILASHMVVHAHPNNAMPPFVEYGVEIPRIIEYTFLRKDRQASREFETSFPHTYDCDCCCDKPSVVLPKSWINGLD
jgi:hypothetical protein